MHGTTVKASWGQACSF